MPRLEDPAAPAPAPEEKPRASRPSDAPMVFLAGPPGSGKSALGSRACAELGLRFADLDDDGRTGATLEEVVRTRAADVVTVPWAPARDAGWLGLCRSSGETMALWAHPLDMQARSGRAESLFKPVKGRKTRGGFGRDGIACSEFRHFERACPNVLLLVGLPEEAAGTLLREAVEDLRSPKELSLTEGEGLLGWCDDWRHDFGADARACEILVDAMARFTMRLRAQGTSPRTMSGVYRDLNAAGFLRDSALIGERSGEP